MQLKAGTVLQSGKYEIVRTIGQGGFGITYEAFFKIMNGKVVVKEFFMKDVCNRDGETSFMSVPSVGSKALVEKFKAKFVKEAQTIFSYNHPNIVRVMDVFEENGTAYYVMDYLPGGSLKAKVDSSPLPEQLAEKYIREVASALDYVHKHNTVHLDVKPANILLNSAGEAVLIDFGISKHYDKAGEQTSSTPVGISKGYAPLEQVRDGDVKQFGPSTDIYALGATLYHLFSGQVPPEASIVNEDGLDRPAGISDRMWSVITKSMEPKRKDRPQSIAEFLSLLDSKAPQPVKDDDDTIVINKPKPAPKPAPAPKPTPSPKPAPKKTWHWALLGGIVAAVVIVALILGGHKEKGDDDPVVPKKDSTEVVVPVTPKTEPVELTPAKSEPAKPAIQAPEAPAAPGSLKIESTPKGATIWLDGKNTKKTTPDVFEDVAAGKHSIRLALEGYNESKGSVTVESGKRAAFDRTLTETPKPQAASSDATSSQSQSQQAPNNSSSSTGNVINGHEYVDLGLSVKWATCNVGASSPSDYGSYFAWGETSTKSEYTWVNYKFRSSGDSYDNVTFWKYNTKSEKGTVDSKTTLDRSDDAARANWGGSWRMPTRAEQDELRRNCTWTWKSMGGHNGYKVTSKKNGNSIFLPAAGYRDGSSLNDAGSRGCCWSSSLNADSPFSAYILYFNSSFVVWTGNHRYFGQSVRPVTE